MRGPRDGSVLFYYLWRRWGSVSGAGQSVGTPDHACHPQTERRGSALH